MDNEPWPGLAPVDLEPWLDRNLEGEHQARGRASDVAVNTLKYNIIERKRVWGRERELLFHLVSFTLW